MAVHEITHILRAAARSGACTWPGERMHEHAQEADRQGGSIQCIQSHLVVGWAKLLTTEAADAKRLGERASFEEVWDIAGAITVETSCVSLCSSHVSHVISSKFRSGHATVMSHVMQLLMSSRPDLHWPSKTIHSKPSQAMAGVPTGRSGPHVVRLGPTAFSKASARSCRKALPPTWRCGGEWHRCRHPKSDDHGWLVNVVGVYPFCGGGHVKFIVRCILDMNPNFDACVSFFLEA